MVQTGSGTMQSSSQANVQRRERLRQMALEAADIANDPYFMKNHLGTYECKLCLTLHTNEGSYLAHTQAKRHQENLAKRNLKLARENALSGPSASSSSLERPKKMLPRIGRPGYKVIKQRDPVSGARSLLFHLLYPQLTSGLRPRYRIMSSYEQKVEQVQDKYQYVVFAAEPYETIAFKIPSTEIDRDPAKLFVHFDEDNNTFTLQIHFKPPSATTTASHDKGLDSDNEDDDMR